MVIVALNSDGVNYGRQKVDYELSCDSDVRDPEWNMTLSWTGTATSYNDSAIETDVPGFGIELDVSCTPLCFTGTAFS